MFLQHKTSHRLSLNDIHSFRLGDNRSYFWSHPLIRRTCKMIPVIINVDANELQISLSKMLEIFKLLNDK